MDGKTGTRYLVVAIAGPSYPAARALARRLRAAGHTVLPLPRTPGRLPAVDAVVNFRKRGLRTLLDRLRDLPRPAALFEPGDALFEAILSKDSA